MRMMAIAMAMTALGQNGGAAGPQPPRPGPVKTFGAWAVACDNVHACEMTSLWPDENQPEEGSAYDQITVSVARAAGPAGGWTVEIQLPADSGTSALQVSTEKMVAARAAPRQDILRLGGADATRIVTAMASGADLRVGDEFASLGIVSLKGSSAALRFIDAEQGRAGTVTAAVAKGTKPATSVPVAPALPVVASARPGGTAAALPPAMRKALDKASECGAVYEGGTGDLPKPETVALGGGKTLVLLPCGSGAYNFSTKPYIMAAGAKPVVAEFDFRPGMEPEGPPELVNASFDAKTGRLESFAKGRGLGDCGAAEVYVWDGAMFRLVEARAMPDCRGSVNWLTTWRAAPVPR